MSNARLTRIATAAQATAWLEQVTNESWSLVRLLEVQPHCYVWLDWSSSAHRDMFAGRNEGFLAPLCFAGDTQRLIAGAQDLLVTWTRNPEGKLCRFTPGLRLPLEALRFKREDLEALAARQGRGHGARPRPNCEKPFWPRGGRLAPSRPLSSHPVQDQSVRKNELIAMFKREWPSIGHYLKHGSENGLSKAAKDITRRGWWYPKRVRAWLEQSGRRRRSDDQPSTAPPFSSRLHKTK